MPYGYDLHGSYEFFSISITFDKGNAPSLTGYWACPSM